MSLLLLLLLDCEITLAFLVVSKSICCCIDLVTFWTQVLLPWWFNWIWNHIFVGGKSPNLIWWDCLLHSVVISLLWIEILQLPEPFSFIFTWFAAIPLIVWLSISFTNLIVKDFLILKVSTLPFSHAVHYLIFGDTICSCIQGPCPNCGTENVSFFGTILSIASGGSTNKVKCSK